LNKVFKIDYLSRVEGESGIIVRIKDGKIARLEVNVFEAPRFFESLLRGRPCDDAIDFTARICGICPVAYQMSSVHAMEKIFGIEPPKPIRVLRRLFYSGEWIESHALHVYFLQGPDFFDIESGWASRRYLPIAKRGLELKRLGNKLLSIIGGRSVHPVSVRTGGFYKTPGKKELTQILPDLERAYERALEEIRWAASLPFSDRTLETEYVALKHPDEYPMNSGRVVSNRGVDASMEGFLDGIREYQVAHSTSLHSGLVREKDTTPYLVGPVARLNLNHERLPQEIQDILKESGVGLPIKNIQMGIIARTVEVAYAFGEAIGIIKNYEAPERASVDFEPAPGSATWITEAPRGILIHRYELDDRGYIRACSIIPPTSQNLGHMESELYHFLEANLDKPLEFLKKESTKIGPSKSARLSFPPGLTLFSFLALSMVFH
jgi:coenzyme F420-reducing hydrogenase alpha subunit